MIFTSLNSFALMVLAQANTLEPPVDEGSNITFALWLAVGALVFAFWMWMLVDAFLRGEFIWAVLVLLFFNGITPLLYFILVYLPAWRSGGGSAGGISGFELPGSGKRRRIKELEADISLLDRPHHHLELGDVYFEQGKLAKARESYEAAYERDSDDIDIRAHLGQCRVRQGEAAAALPLLEGVVKENPKHDWGYSAMALAEAYAAQSDSARAAKAWEVVLKQYTYARARVQYARILVEQGKTDEARAQLEEVIASEGSLPDFQKRKEMKWIREAKADIKKLS